MGRPEVRAMHQRTAIRPPSLLRRAGDSAAAWLERSGVLKLQFQRQRGLRILCYHGICADELVGQPWVPPYFVGVSAFGQQLETLRRFGPIVHLPDVADALASQRWSETSASAITFDDVPACTFALARPLLARNGVRASFFISTGQVTTGRLFWSDLLRVLRHEAQLLSARERAALEWLLADPAQHKQMTLMQLFATLEQCERAVRSHLAATVRETLRPLNWQEVRALADDGHDIGGHTVDHVILGWQPDDIRRQQIRGCLEAIEERLGRRPVGFAYPNGGPGDFGLRDWEIMRSFGVRYAVSTCPGFAPGPGVFALPRLTVGGALTTARFALELCGWLDGRRRRQYGWR